MRFIVAPLLLIIVSVLQVVGQDTLPKFSAVAKANGKVIISWRNTYRKVNQISIQRSYDSLKNFTTLLTVPDPSIPENGFVDSKPPGTNVYYRLFILLSNSKYLFSKSRRAIPEQVAESQIAASQQEPEALPKIDNLRIVYLQPESTPLSRPVVVGPSTISGASTIEVEKTIYIRENDSVIGKIQGKLLRQFRDSILNKTKDTILFVQADTVLIKPYIAPLVVNEGKETYKVSTHVFTAKDGNVSIFLPDAGRKKYSVKFFEADDAPVLEIKDIRDAQLIVDKSNFLHSGWFRFELYEEGKLKEKNRLYIPREF
jgi:hypothetical protein